MKNDGLYPFITPVYVFPFLRLKMVIALSLSYFKYFYFFLHNLPLCELRNNTGTKTSTVL